MTTDLFNHATAPPVLAYTPGDPLFLGNDKEITMVAAAAVADPTSLEDWDISELLLPAPDRAHLVGRYCHLGQPPNRNGHLFRPEEMADAHRYIPFTALDMLHDPRRIVGTYSASRIVYPNGQPTANPAARSDPYGETPYVQVVSTMWSYLFPDDAETMATAFNEGNAFFSMSCRPMAGVTCPTCEHTAPWAGYSHESYCDHMQGTNAKWMNKPLFLGGAVIVPPVKPGWHAAHITKVAAFAKANPELAHEVFTRLAAEAGTAGPEAIEAMTMQVLALAHADDPLMAKTVSRTIAVASGVANWEAVAGGYGSIGFLPPPAARAELEADERTAPVLADAGAQLTPTEVRQVVDALDDDPSEGAAWAREVWAAMVHLDLELMAPTGAPRSHALDDGSFPLPSAAWLPKAILAFPRAADAETAKRHLLARARDLGAPPNVVAEIEQLGQHAAQVAAAEAQRGVIVALSPPREIREKLAAVGDEPEDQIHLTLAFFGDATGDSVSLEPDGSRSVSFDQLKAAVAAWATTQKPVMASLSGRGHFAAGDDSEVTYASVDSPGLAELVASMYDALDNAGVFWSRLHGFTPHITVAYRPPGEGPTDIPTGLSWPVNEVEIWWADTHHPVKLG